MQVRAEHNDDCGGGCRSLQLVSITKKLFYVFDVICKILETDSMLSISHFRQLCMYNFVIYLDFLNNEHDILICFIKLIN